MVAAAVAIIACEEGRGAVLAPARRRRGRRPIVLLDCASRLGIRRYAQRARACRMRQLRQLPGPGANPGRAGAGRPEDRARTEAAAKNHCNHPVVIVQGPSGGVMMYPADQSQLQEFWLKGSVNRKNYIGPHGEGGQPGDREIVSYDGRVMVLRFVDPEVAGRYGTGVYVRCAPRA